MNSIQLSADHSATIDTVAATWTVYSANPDVLVLDVAPGDIDALVSTNARLQPLILGAKLVIALRQGHLQTGWLYPSTFADKSIQFSTALPASLLSALNAVIATPR
ncbi:hypothetical protein [Burkholderia glumae]|uniref:hypothetical protein n=1 Tax=Burkholderia glumae TaxID=337 RepID=UPI0020B30ABB|nr:hypothetical protein [Burkholderia glumae]